MPLGPRSYFTLPTRGEAMQTFTDYFDQYLSEFLSSDLLFSICNIEPALHETQYGTLPGLTIRGRVHDPRDATSFEIEAPVVLGEEAYTDLLAYDECGYFCKPEREQHAMSAIANSLDAVLGCFGLDRQNLLEHQGWQDAVTMPEWLAQAFIACESGGSPELSDPEEIREYEAALAELDASGRTDSIQYMRGSNDGGDWEIVFVPKDVLTRELPEIDRSLPLTFEQEETLKDFIAETGWEHAVSPEAAAALLGDFSRIPQNMKAALAEAVAEKLGFSQEALKTAAKALEGQLMQDSSCKQTAPRCRSRGKSVKN